MSKRARILTGGTLVLHLAALHLAVAHFWPAREAALADRAGAALAARGAGHLDPAETDPLTADRLAAALAEPSPGFVEGEPDSELALPPANPSSSATSEAAEGLRAMADSIGVAVPELPELPELTTRPGPLDLNRLIEVDGRLVADLGQGWTGELTTDVPLQKAAQRILDQGRIPFGAVVVLDVASGDVLAMADRYDEQHEVAPKLSTDGPAHLALRAIAPSASVFKIVTSAALLEAGLSPTRAYPYRTAMRRLQAEHIEDPGKGANTSDLGDALADSNNGFFARQAEVRLSREDLDAVARRFGYGRLMRFGLKVEASTLQVPRGRLERARLAAGFWHSTLTPLHAALIAAAVAGDGTLPTPHLVRRITSPEGRAVDAPAESAFGTATTPEHARALRRMLARTTTSGTARRAWQKWPAKLAAIKVGGKTGTLSKADPATTYTWFVGFAPVDNPQVAIAVLVGNGKLWWQRAPDVARDVLAWHFSRSPEERSAERGSAQGAAGAKTAEAAASAAVASATQH